MASPQSLPARTMALLSYRHLSGCGGPFPHPSSAVAHVPHLWEETKGKPWRKQSNSPPQPGTRPDLRSFEPPNHPPQLLPAMGLLRLKPVTQK